MKLRRFVLAALAALAAAVFTVPAIFASEPVEAATGLVVDLGTTPIGSPVTATITFANPSSEVELPLSFDADEPGFAIVAPPELLAPAERVEFPITLLAEEAGEYELTVRIYREFGADDQDDPMITFSVVGVVTQ